MLDPPPRNQSVEYVLEIRCQRPRAVRVSANFANRQSEWGMRSGVELSEGGAVEMEDQAPPVKPGDKREHRVPEKPPCPLRYGEDDVGR